MVGQGTGRSRRLPRLRESGLFERRVERLAILVALAQGLGETAPDELSKGAGDPGLRSETDEGSPLRFDDTTAIELSPLNGRCPVAIS
ncbi:MAG: hypothetical protein QF681_00895 [Vicinamibacterales bacterium]|nr:hypothetical protein [Vicinamibacterales bacterium]